VRDAARRNEETAAVDRVLLALDVDEQFSVEHVDRFVVVRM